MKTAWAIRKLSALVVVARLVAPVVAPRFRDPQDHPWPIEGRTVFVDDREFVVRQVGPEDGDDIVLIHGLGGSALTEWFEVGPLLAANHRVTLVEHRNHGMAPLYTGRYEIADLADDVAAVMAEVAIDRAHVAGYSMGATIAQELAHRHPQLVDRMILIGAFASHPPAWRTARQIGTYLIRAWERVTGVGTPEVRAGYLIISGAVAPHHAQWMWEETHRRNVEGAAAASLALMRFDSTAWVGTIEVPTLVIVAAKDQLVPPAWQYALAGMIPGARLVDVADGRHELPWTHAERLAGEIEAFVAE